MNMMNRAKELSAWIMPVLFGVVAILQALAVGELGIAAIWQWYKFKDYGGGGHIMMSAETAIWFVSLSAGSAIFGIWLGRKAEAALLRKKIIKAFCFIVVGSLITYLALALSPLNSWRP